MKQQMFPGFTAEQSLFKVKGKYFVPSAFEKSSGSIEPAQIFSGALGSVALPFLCPDCSQAFWVCPPSLPWLPPGRCFLVCPLVNCAAL